MTLRKTILSTSGLALALGLSACNSGGLEDNTPMAPPPPPPITGNVVKVERCFDQMVDGKRVRDILIPDLVTLDLSRPANFPNGRRLQDQVIDLELAILFLDQTRHTPTTLNNVPLNPNVFDQPLRTSFPYFAAALGTPRLSDTNGTNFNFRTDPASSYIRVERVGVPAISTALMRGNNKILYNENSPALDENRSFEPEMTATLTGLAGALVDDLQGLGLVVCATQG